MTDQRWGTFPGSGEGEEPPPPDPNQQSFLPPDAGTVPESAPGEGEVEAQGAGAEAHGAEDGAHETEGGAHEADGGAHGPEPFQAGWDEAQGRTGPPPQEPIVPRVYYSIGEVCDLTGLKPHVLRYWETQFEVMNPTKNRAGNRVYRPKDIDLVFLVKRLLYEEKYTIEGARQRLLELRKEGSLDDEKQDVLGPEFLAEIKRELLSLNEILNVPGAG